MSPTARVLHGVVRDHLETFLATAAARTDGVGLPPFVEREFRSFLRCGLLVHGFCRVRCDDCSFERLVPFSCKARAVCSSCGGRRMAERAAHLVGAVLPTVPVRQWVLTVPYRLRYRLAFDHALCRAVLGVFVHPRLLDDLAAGETVARASWSTLLGYFEFHAETAENVGQVRRWRLQTRRFNCSHRFEGGGVERLITGRVPNADVADPAVVAGLRRSGGRQGPRLSAPSTGESRQPVNEDYAPSCGAASHVGASGRLLHGF